MDFSFFSLSRFSSILTLTTVTACPTSFYLYNKFDEYNSRYAYSADKSNLDIENHFEDALGDFNLNYVPNRNFVKASKSVNSPSKVTVTVDANSDIDVMGAIFKAGFFGL